MIPQNYENLLTLIVFPRNIRVIGLKEKIMHVKSQFDALWLKYFFMASYYIIFANTKSIVLWI